ncbi:MAG: caspase family protein [Paludibacteraceae bacterium]|nr:caspase family protein [Paludibacteraceae bacterium]
MQKRVVVIFLLATLSTVVLHAAGKYALVIGIGPYPAKGGWNLINGDKDIPAVLDLLQANGFQSKDIATLKNEKATCAAIQAEFYKLINKVNKGDVVYIHFSGHGQQITDVHGDEEDGYDEAWIPYDAARSFKKGVYEGQNHILDDQLNLWLTSIRGKIGDEGKIVVVADACHSGEMTRSVTDTAKVVVRGTSDIFKIPGEFPQYTMSNQNTVQWVQISACKSYQCNFEYNGMGSLTYALCQQKEQLGSLSNASLLNRIKGTIKQVVPFTQSPTMDIPSDSKEDKVF